MPPFDPAALVTEDIVRSMLGDLASGARGPFGQSMAITTADRIVMEAVYALSASGAMARIEGCDVHDTRFLKAWNALADGTCDDGRVNGSRIHHTATVARSLAPPLVAFPLMDAERAARKAGAEVDVGEATARMRTALVDGTLPRFAMVEPQTCRITGTRLHILMEGWRPVMGVRDPGTGTIVPSTAVPPPPVETATVAFRGGPVLVADWFRVEGFDEAVEVPEELEFTPEFDLCTEVGARGHVRHYAKLGFVSVFVGNTSPDILSFGDEIVVGNLDEEADAAGEAPTPLGSVCTDLWRVTMIERERLVELVAESCDRDEAERRVADFLEDGPTSVTELAFEAGEYVIHFGGLQDHFGKHFHSDDLPIPGCVDPLFVLARRELELSPNPAPDDTVGGPAPR